MKKLERIFVIIVLISMCTFAVKRIVALPLNTASITANEELPRFIKIKTFTFQKGWNSKIGTIYRDTETNIKYLYVYRTGENGAAMTRLWEN